MIDQQRRIRRLQLHGPDAARLHQARMRLEEAFRIASLPGLPPNAQVLIRRLDLGTIAADDSPLRLSDRIGERIRRLAGDGICVDEAEADDAELVWFSDPLQPCRALLIRLLEGRSLRQWYWRALFPGLQPAADASTVTHLLLESCKTPLRGLAPAAMIRACLESPRLSRLLPLISASLTRQVAVAQGFLLSAGREARRQGAPGGRRPTPPSADASIPISRPRLDRAWHHALVQAADLWGGDDPRTVWFAAQALVWHRPACIGQRDLLERLQPAAWLAAGAQVSQTADEGRQRVGELPPSDASAGWPSAGEASVGLPPLPTVGGGAAAGGGTAADAATAGIAGPPSEAALPSESASSLPVAAGWDQALSSDQAGFGLLIALIQRLGMAELLAENPDLVALDFPCRLLRAMAIRFGVGAADPVWGLLPALPPPDHALVRFEAPPAWWHQASLGGRPLRCLQSPVSGRRWIVEPRGRWLLALRSAGGAESGCGGAEWQPPAMATDRPLTVDAVIGSMQLLAGDWLRRNCGLPLRRLVNRPGRVALAVTHWDLLFRLNQVDLRLRRVALDSDPGWVDWLGRVVQVHYD